MKVCRDTNHKKLRQHGERGVLDSEGDEGNEGKTHLTDWYRRTRSFGRFQLDSLLILIKLPVSIQTQHISIQAVWNIMPDLGLVGLEFAVDRD
jgi:hypothetical protein